MNIACTHSFKCFETRLQTLQYDKRSRNACTVELVLETITTFSLKYLHLKL